MDVSSQIDAFVAAASVPARLMEGLSPADLNAQPVPGKWSLRTLIIHLWDSDAIATHRMKRIIAEDRPLLMAYDEDAFVARLGYEQQDLGLVAELFRLNREHTGQILRSVSAADFARAGVHNQRGLITLADTIGLYVHHVEHHLVFARAKLQALGKPVRV